MPAGTRPRRFRISAEPSAARAWLAEIAQRLEGLGHSVRLCRADGPAGRREIAWLERLDRALHGAREAGLAAPLPVAALAPPDADCGEIARHGGVVLERLGDDGEAELRLGIRFDGVPGDAGLFAALLDWRPPLIEVVNEAAGSSVASGVASLESARSILGAADAVLARAVTLVVSVVARRSLHTAAVAGPAPARATAETPTTQDFTLDRLARHAAAKLAGKVPRALYEAACHFPHWRVGWRFGTGEGAWRGDGLTGGAWQVLPDPGDRFYADPFPVLWQGRRMIFMEDLPHATGRGVVSAVEITDKGPAGLPVPVLEEPWHLSYPFLMEDRGELWMIPESSTARKVELYRAARFPDRWTKEATLLEGVEASDATIVRHGGKLWLFASVRDGAGAHSDQLWLYSAERLTGPWRPHAGNPVLVDARAARPAGGMVVQDGRLWRPAQICDQGYGLGLALAEVTRLDDAGFEQQVHHVLRPSAAWPGRKLHTLNAAGGIECIDGSAIAPRYAPLARLLEPWCLRRGPDP